MISVSNSGKNLNRKMAVVFLGGVIALTGLFLLSLCFGEAIIPVRTIVNALFHRQNILEHNMIWDLRMPRTVMGILAGGALAVAGALLQTITRNPLAASDTLGINAGAYFVVVLGTILFPAALHQSPFLFAVFGGIGAAAVAYFMGGGARSNPVRLALSGMIVSMLLGSFTSALRILFSEETEGMFMWGAGTLEQNDWSGVQYAWPWVVSALLIAILCSKQWDILNFDDSTASSLGQKVGTARAGGLLLSVLLAAIVVSVIGPIGFVGLVAPHLVRLMGARLHRYLLPASFLWGAALLLGADILARMLQTASMRLPTGAIMAVIGAPWLIWLVLTKIKTKERMSPSESTGGSRTLFRRFSYWQIATVFLIMTIALILLSTMFGGMKIPANQLLPSIFQPNSAFYPMMQVRIPRTLTAAGAGAALAISGVLIQIAVRNPLADASIVGVSSGAGLGAMLLLYIFPGVSIYFLPGAAIAGAGIAALFIFMLSWKKGLNPSAVVLMGIAVSALGSSGIQILTVRKELLGNAGYIWLTGSTYARGWTQVQIIGAFLLVLVPFGLWLAYRFELLKLDDESAVGLGLSVRNTRLLAMLAGVLLAAGAVACVGTIGFIGLIAPHMVRMITRHPLRHFMFLSALSGALILVLADTIGRTVIAPTEVPSGLLVALIGTPYFLYLMYTSNNHKPG